MIALLPFSSSLTEPAKGDRLHIYWLLEELLVLSNPKPLFYNFILSAFTLSLKLIMSGYIANIDPPFYKEDNNCEQPN